MPRSSIRRLLACLIGAGLLGASVPTLADEDEPVKVEDPTLPKQDLTPQILLQFLLAEIAGARGDLNQSVKNYLDLARTTRDPRIARRATEIALFARKQREALEAARLWASQAPDSEDAIQILTGLLAGGMGKLDEVEPLLARLLARAGKNPETVLLNLNRILARYPDKAEVRSSVDRLTAPYLKAPEAHFARAHAAFNAGDKEAAMSQLDQALALRRDWEAPALLKTQLLQQAGQTKEAISFLRGFVSRAPDARAARKAYAGLLATDKQFDASLKEFAALSAANPDDGELLYMHALLLIQSNKSAQAEPLLKKVIEQGGADVDASRIQLGQIYEDTQRTADAMAIYRQVGGAQRPSAQARAALLQAKGGDLAGARAELRSLRESSPKDARSFLLAETQILREMNQPQEAFALLDTQLAQTPDDLDLLYDHALLAELTDRPEVMERELRRLIAARPNDPQAYNALGYSLADRNQRLDEALELIRKAHELSPEDGFILDSLGWALYRKGDLAAALIELKRAFALRPDPEIAAHLGEVLWHSGSKDDARRIWQEAQHKHPDNEELARTIKRFER